MEELVTAARARIATHRESVAATEQELARAVSWARRWSAEFPHFLANHLPMALVALQRMGASAERLEAYCCIYQEANALTPTPEPSKPIVREDWREFLGHREREGDYRIFFSGEVARMGATPAAVHYLPTLYAGFAASALHAFMRMAYATFTDSEQETAVALAYWAATYLSLGVATTNPPSTEDPLEVLAYMHGPECFKRIEPERDLLWHFMRAVALTPAFAPVVDRLAIGASTRAKIAKISIAMLAATDDFCALHAVTGCHWLRMIEPRTPDDATPLRYFWQAIAALVPKMGFPEIPCEEQLACWRRTPLPDWPDIFRKAIAHDDEHDISLSFSASQEFEVYGDPLYKYVAAKRLKLI